MDFKKANWGDTTAIKAKGDKAGVEFDLKVAEGTLGMDYGYGWVDFDYVKLTAGKKDTRGSMKRVNPLDKNWWDNYCEYSKPGVHKKFAQGYGIDSGNLTADAAGNKATSFLLESKNFGGFVARVANYIKKTLSV